MQNEPVATQRWDSRIYTAEEERDFIRDHLGPALAQAGLGHIQIVIWNHNRDEMVIYGLQSCVPGQLLPIWFEF